MSVLLLGFVQPGYNHFIDTISVLVLGKWGWIQHINFFVLALGLSAIGVGFAFTMYRGIRSRVPFAFYTIGSLVFLLSIFSADPVDRTRVVLTKLNSLEGAIHFSLTILLVVGTIPLVFSLTRAMKKNPDFKRYARYTLAVFFTNFIGGIAWFICRRLGILFLWKGLWQKLLAANILVWMAIIGRGFIRQSLDK